MNYPDLSNLTSRKEWAEFVGAHLERKAFPLIPYALNGMSPAQILDELRQRANKRRHDKDAVAAWRVWLFECFDVEGHNEIILRTAFRAIQICDEAGEEMGDLRKRIVRWLWDDWSIDAAELAKALKDRSGYAAWKAQDCAAFPLDWRDPGGARYRRPREDLTSAGTSS